MAGVLPVHQMRDYIAPVDLLVRKIPYTILNLFYHMRIIDKGLDGRTMLETFSRLRGYHAGGAHGGFDLNRASKHILLDFLAGLLLYVELPPGYDNSDKKINQSNWSFDDTWKQVNQIEKDDVVKQAVVQKNREDGLVDQDTFFDKDSQMRMIETLAETLTDEDILALLDGKKVREIKFDKNLRREVKHMIKREEVLTVIYRLGHRHPRRAEQRGGDHQQYETAAFLHEEH